MVLVLGIVKASLKILGIGIGVIKVVLLMSDTQPFNKEKKHYDTRVICPQRGINICRVDLHGSKKACTTRPVVDSIFHF